MSKRMARIVVLLSFMKISAAYVLVLSGVVGCLLPSVASAAWGNNPAARVESRTHSQSHRAHEDRSFETEPAALDLLRKIEFLQQEMQELRGKVEEQAYELKKTQEQNKKLYVDLDQRLRQKESGLNEEGARFTDSSEKSNLETLGSTAAPNHSEAVLSTSHTAELAVEERLYQNAYRCIQNKDYDNALSIFQDLVNQFSKGKYLPNAYYWMGEIHMVKGDFTSASSAFNRVYSQYPDHPKAADSLLKLGYVEYAKGDWKRSKDLLSQVKRQFPGSTSAQLADGRLQLIHQEGH